MAGLQTNVQQSALGNGQDEQDQNPEPEARPRLASSGRSQQGATPKQILQN